MLTKSLLRRPKKQSARPRKKVFNKIVENDFIRRVSYAEYREKVRDVYDGPQGALLATASMLSGHLALGDRMLRERKFDLRGAKQILDVGSGAGQIAKHLLKYADHDARLTCFDLSFEMLRRARNRLKSDAPSHLVADLTRLPFADNSFDCVTCGYVLEHLPDDVRILRALRANLKRGARLVLTVPAHQHLWSYADEYAAHYRRYGTKQLRAALEKAGFQVEFLTQFMMLLYPLLWLGRRWNSRGQVNTMQDQHERVARELRVTPLTNAVLHRLLKWEAGWIARRWRLPLGTSLLAIASVA